MKYTKKGIQLGSGTTSISHDKSKEIVKKHTAFESTSLWTIGDAILADDQVNRVNLTSALADEFAGIRGYARNKVRTQTRACYLWPIDKRDESIPFSAYELLAAKYKKWRKEDILQALEKYKTEKWTNGQLRKYIHKMDTVLRFQKDTSPDATTDDRSLQSDTQAYTSVDAEEEVSAKATVRYTKESDPSEFYIVDRKDKVQTIAHFPFKLKDPSSKARADKMADVCLQYLVTNCLD